MLDILPLNVDEAAERLTSTLNVKVNKKYIPYDSPRVLVIHPPYLCPPTINKIV